MVRERTEDGEFLKYLLIYSNKLSYLQLITAYNSCFRKETVFPKVMNNITYTFSKKKNFYLEKYLGIKITLLKMKFFCGIFQGFCSKVSDEFFYRTPPCIFVVIVIRLCTFFLRKPRIMLTIRSIMKSFYFPNRVFL